MDDNPYAAPKSQTPSENQPLAQPPNSTEVSGMKGHELFGVIVRTLGLCMLIAAIYYTTGLVFPAPGRQRADYVPSVAIFTALGSVPFLFADGLVRIAYWRERL